MLLLRNARFEIGIFKNKILEEFQKLSSCLLYMNALYNNCCKHHETSDRHKQLMIWGTCHSFRSKNPAMRRS